LVWRNERHLSDLQSAARERYIRHDRCILPTSIWPAVHCKTLAAGFDGGQLSFDGDLLLRALTLLELRCSSDLVKRFGFFVNQFALAHDPYLCEIGY
jgi:hypothetical protein